VRGGWKQSASAAGDLARLEALRADLSLLHRPVDHDAHLLDVGVHHPIGDAVRVADVAACGRVLAAYAADLGHVIGSCRVSLRCWPVTQAAPWWQKAQQGYHARFASGKTVTRDGSSGECRVPDVAGQPLGYTTQSDAVR